MSFYDYSVSKRKGGELPLSEFRGRVVLVVNTATGCMRSITKGALRFSICPATSSAARRRGRTRKSTGSAPRATKRSLTR